MAGMAAKVVVTERQFAILDEFRGARSEPGWVVQRAEVILLAFEKWSNPEIAAEVGLDRMAVGPVVGRTSSSVRVKSLDS